MWGLCVGKGTDKRMLQIPRTQKSINDAPTE